MGRVEALWLKRVRKGPMDRMDEVEAIVDHGLKGNANVGGRRQVTVIAMEVWERLRGEMGPDARPELRRANVLVSGIELEGARGRRLRIGEATVEIGGETRPCNLMEESLPGLQEALASGWGGGVFGIVTRGGVIRVGDAASLE